MKKVFQFYENASMKNFDNKRIKTQKIKKTVK